jgi:taurine---2-oxoglutarate transaminase
MASPINPLDSPVLFTWTAQKNAVPQGITGGRGVHFMTDDGARWLDFGSMVWNANLGHGHAGMTAAMTLAASRGLLVQPSSIFDDKLRAARSLLEVAPAGLRSGKVFFCLSGAEANENAVKMALLYTGRRKIIHRTKSYHGATLSMLALSGDPRRIPFEPGNGMGIAWSDPYSALPCEGDLESIIEREGSESIAAVLLEGIVGANGVVIPPEGYFKRVRELCTRHGILFIADEILSGFGRTGAWFAIDHDGVTPDLLTCGKALTGGYAPGAAVVVAPTLAHHFDDNVLSCGLTAYAHPLTCAAIAAAIETYRKENLISRAAEAGAWLEPMLENLAVARPFVRNVRGKGLLWAVDLFEPDGDSTATTDRMKALARSLQEARIHLHKRDHQLFIAPPLCIARDELAQGLSIVARCLDTTWRTP